MRQKKGADCAGPVGAEEIGERILNLLLVVLLALLWGGVFIPSLLRARQDASPFSSVRSFRTGMLALSRKARFGDGGRWILMPPPNDEGRVRLSAMERRRRVLGVLISAAGASLILALLPALRFMLLFHAAVDLLLAAYVALLLQMKAQRRANRRRPAAARRDLRRVIPDEPEYARAAHF